MTSNQPSLTGKQARYLRGLGHSLKPLLQLGKGGITDPFVKQVARALETHELIKIKLIRNAPDSLIDASEELAARIPCQIAQKIGKTLLLYRPREEDPEIVLPS